MDFALNEEQTLLRDSVRRFVDQDYGFEQRRRLVAHEGGFSAKHWAQFAQLGWLGAGLPEAAGGFGGGVIETAIIAEQLGRGLVVEPFVPVAVLAAQALWHAGGALPVVGALVDGTCRIAPALNDAVDAPATVHAADNGARRLVGRKTLVVGGPQADRFLVSAAEGNGVSLPRAPRPPLDRWHTGLRPAIRHRGASRHARWRAGRHRGCTGSGATSHHGHRVRAGPRRDGPRH
jgi:alkylation response protein AidB-like acyl-CoA dehydrogenase